MPATNRTHNRTLVGPAVLSLVLAAGFVLGVPVVGGHTAVASADQNFQSDCPGLAGLTVQWQGNFNVPGLGSGTWSGPMTIDDLGDLSGTATSGGTTSSWAGNVQDDCTTLTYTAAFTGGSSVSSGTNDFSVDYTNNTLVFEANFQVTLGTTIYPGGTATGTGYAVPTVTITPPSPPALPTSSGPVTYTFTVTGTGPEYPAPTPMNDVFGNDGQSGMCMINPAPLVSGSATCTIPGESAGTAYTIGAAYTGDGNYTTATGSMTIATGVSDGSTTDSTMVNDSSDQVTVTGNGGTSSDTATEVGYGSDPVQDLMDGTNFFDLAVSQPSGFTSIIVQDCNKVVPNSTVLQWYNGISWQPVEVPAGNTTFPYGQTYSPPGCVSAVLSNSPATSPSLAALNHTVFGAIASRTINSADSANASTRHPFSLTVTTSGSPTPSITETGKLPKGLRLKDHHNGTATLSGTPRRTSGGLYQPTITATYGSGQVVRQVFTLFVFQPPTMKGRVPAHAHVGSPYTASLTAKGFPLPTIKESGRLPNGINPSGDTNGKFTLTGTPEVGSAGTYPITITASNGEGVPVKKSVSLEVSS